MRVYFAKHTNADVVKNSSSGGIFSLLANKIIQDGGIVFGAVFDDNFNVIITYTTDDYSKMVGSKYVQSSVGQSYHQCKDFLEQGRLVLFTGSPCQITGLKSYLKHDYDNLITMDVICHGQPIKAIWQHYLKSFEKPIKTVNFRDKRNGWSNFNITIAFTDGTEYTESPYMKLFLDNKILKQSCYKCKCNRESNADITVGDAWGLKSNLIEFTNNTGVSCVITRTERGDRFFNQCTDKYVEQTTEEFLENSVGYVHHYSQDIDTDSVKNSILSPKIAMVTIPGHKNVGNTLQAFALQHKVKELIPSATIEIIDDHNIHNDQQQFYKSYVNSTDNGFSDSYDMLLVGSDQIWGKTITTDWKIPLSDRFGLYNIRRIFYAPSFGFAETTYDSNELSMINRYMQTARFVSNREAFGSYLTEKWFNVRCKNVLDPAFLYDEKFYMSYVKNDGNYDHSDIFTYILDSDNLPSEKLSKICNELNTVTLPYDGSVENFLLNMNQCRCVITDSYHGTVFSLIFNKPFVCIKNKARGSLRFDDLQLKFKLSPNRFIDNIDDLNSSILTVQPNINIEPLRMRSINFLNAALHQL